MSNQIGDGHVGERIRSAREAKGLTQSALGAKLSNPFTATAISLYEKGERDVSVSILEEIARILEVSFTYLATGIDKESPSISVALRADKDLRNNLKAQDQITDFIEYVKSKSREKSGQ